MAVPRPARPGALAPCVAVTGPAVRSDRVCRSKIRPAVLRMFSSERAEMAQRAFKRDIEVYAIAADAVFEGTRDAWLQKIVDVWRPIFSR